MKQPSKPRTCATHNPGSPDCGPNCPDALRDPNATPGLVFAMADGTKVGAPADVARANQDMDDAVDDIEQRDDDSDEVDTDIEGDEDDGPMESTDEEQAEVSRRDELRDENANLRLRIVELERANQELTRRERVAHERANKYERAAKLSKE